MGENHNIPDPDEVREQMHEAVKRVREKFLDVVDDGLRDEVRERNKIAEKATKSAAT